MDSSLSTGWGVHKIHMNGRLIGSGELDELDSSLKVEAGPEEQYVPMKVLMIRVGRDKGRGSMDR